MKSLTALIRRGVNQFNSDSLFRNAVFLMASTAIMSVLGFGFWLFVAHLYSSSQIGNASALISITLLISNLSFFGLNAGFIRFLPTSKRPSGDINASLIVVAVAAMAAAAAYLALFGHGLTGGLAIFDTTLLGRLVFLVLLAAVALNTVTDSIFIASRRAEFHTMAYATFGTIKLILPLLLIRTGSLGIFAAYCVAVLASLGLTFVFMRYSTGYRFFSKPNWRFITDTRRYVTNNYIATLVSGLPSQLMPTLIVHQLGAADAAYFAMAWTMGNLLNVIPSSITNSLLAESSHDLTRHTANVRRAARILAAILIPAVTAAVIVAPYILHLFGAQYAQGGTAIFRLLALTTFALAGISLGSTVMNVEQRSGGIVVVQAVVSIVTLALAIPLMHVKGLGLAGSGLAILLGNLAGNLVQLVLLVTVKPRSITPSVSSSSGPNTAVINEFLDLYSLTGARISSDRGGGDRSATLVITVSTAKYVLKIYDERKRTASHIQAEIQFTDYLRRQGIPAPSVRPNTTAQIISKVRADDVVWLGLLMDFEAGGHPATYSPKLLRDMAEIQGHIHQSGIEYALSRQYDPKDLGASSLRSALIGYVPKGVSHFDFDSGNILVKNDRVVCVVDFEGMRYDPLVVCIYFTLTRLYDQARDPVQLSSYLEAYQGVRKLGLIERTILRAALGLRYSSTRLLALKF